MDVTRVSLRRGNRPDLGCLTESASAEAPRPATNRINGRSPGSRGTGPRPLPGSFQWQCGTGSPLTVAGTAAVLEPAFRTAFPVRSLVRDRRSRALNGRHPRFVNADLPFGLRSIQRRL